MINAHLLQRMINASNDGIVVAEQEGEDNIVIYVNPAFERLTGYSADEVLYQDCRFLQSGDRDQPGLEVIRQALRQGRPCREVLRNYRKDGSHFWNELSITPVFNDSDQLTLFHRRAERRQRPGQGPATLAPAGAATGRSAS